MPLRSVCIIEIALIFFFASLGLVAQDSGNPPSRDSIAPAPKTGKDLKNLIELFQRDFKGLGELKSRPIKSTEHKIGKQRILALWFNPYSGIASQHFHVYRFESGKNHWRLCLEKKIDAMWLEASKKPKSLVMLTSDKKPALVVDAKSLGLTTAMSTQQFKIAPPPKSGKSLTQILKAFSDSYAGIGEFKNRIHRIEFQAKDREKTFLIWFNPYSGRLATHFHSYQFSTKAGKWIRKQSKLFPGSTDLRVELGARQIRIRNQFDKLIYSF